MHFFHDEDSVGDRNPYPDYVRLRPELTYGMLFASGAKLWLSFDPAAPVRPSMTCAMHMVNLNDRYGRDNAVGLLGFGCGLEARF